MRNTYILQFEQEGKTPKSSHHTLLEICCSKTTRPNSVSSGRKIRKFSWDAAARSTNYYYLFVTKSFHSWLELLRDCFLASSSFLSNATETITLKKLLHIVITFAYLQFMQSWQANFAKWLSFSELLISQSQSSRQNHATYNFSEYPSSSLFEDFHLMFMILSCL